MKALVMEAPLDIRLEEVPTPEITEGQALVHILKTGICGGDVHYYDGLNPYSHFPHICGHEMVGRVEKIMGESDIKVGEIVTAELLLPCGECYACKHGFHNCCPNMKAIGQYTPGTYAEYTVYPIKNLHRVPENLTLDDAVVVEPYTIGHHISHRTKVNPGDKCLVIGSGTIGLTIIDTLKAQDAYVMVADLSNARLQTAKEFGADVVINSGEEDLLARVLELTDNQGAAIVFEATGNSRVMGATPDYVAASGTIIIAGVTGKPVTFENGLLFQKKELNVLGSRNAYGSDFEAILKLMSEGKLHQEKLITSKYSMEDAPKGFKKLYEDPSNEIKVVIEIE